MRTFSCKNQRKNQYEDERYELDLVIESNRSAILALEPIKQNLAGHTEGEAGTFKMEALDRTYVFIYYFCKKIVFI